MTARRAASGFLGAAALISALTLVSRLAGFVRVLIFSPTVGATGVGGIYTTANGLPNVIFEAAVGGALAGVVVPVLARPLAARQWGEANRTASALLTWAITLLAPLGLALALASGPIARAMFDDADSAVLGARLIVVFAPQVVLYGVSVVLAGILQADKRFAWPSLVPLLNSIVVIGAYIGYFRATHGSSLDSAQLASDAVTWLGWGTTAGVVALSIPLFLPVWRAGVRLRWTYGFPPGIARRVLSLAGAGVGAVAAQQLSVVVVMWLVNNRGGPGAYAVYVYSQACYTLPYAVLAYPLAVATFPRIAELADTAGSFARERLAALTSVSTRAVLVAGGIGTAGLVAAAPAVEGVFRVIDRSGDAPGLSQTITASALGVIGLSLIALTTRVLYSLSRGRLAIVIGAGAWLVFALVAPLLISLFVPGEPDGPATLRMVGIAFSLAMTVGAVCCFLALRRTLGSATLRALPRTLVMLALGGGVGAVAGRGVVTALVGQSTVVNVLAALVGVAIAAAAIAASVALGDRSLVSDFRRDTTPAIPPTS